MLFIVIENSKNCLSNVISPQNITTLIEAIANSSNNTFAKRRGGSTYAMRNLLTAISEIQVLATTLPVISLVQKILGNKARPVKALLFDKNPAAKRNRIILNAEVRYFADTCY